MQITRRASLAGLAGACVAGPAHAVLPETLRSHRAYPPWQLEGATRAPMPLDAAIELGEGRTSTLREWLGGQPAVLALWATWCNPCLAEKPAQAMMARRLRNANVAARILVLQSYDDYTLAQGRDALKRLRADDLTNARASPEAERAFIDVFGPAQTSRNRTVLPALLLLDGEGVEQGRALGMMFTENRRNYWLDQGTFEFLSQLT